MSLLEWKERTVDGPEPIEKTLYFGLRPIAVAFTDPEAREWTIAWPLAADAVLPRLLDYFLSSFLVHYHQAINPSIDLFQPLRIEFWIGDSYHEVFIDSRESSAILDAVRQRKTGSTDLLELLQISDGHVFLEIVFSTTEQPVRIGLMIPQVHVQSLALFFATFHRNSVIRHDPGLALSAFPELESGAIGPRDPETIHPHPQLNHYDSSTPVRLT